MSMDFSSMEISLKNAIEALTELLEAVQERIDDEQEAMIDKLGTDDGAETQAPGEETE